MNVNHRITGYINEEEGNDARMFEAELKLLVAKYNLDIEYNSEINN